MNRIASGHTAYRALLLASWVSLPNLPATAAGLPEEWLDQALRGVDKGAQAVIRNHIESQLDWRSYYLNRREIRQPSVPPDSLRLHEPFSLNDRSNGAGAAPACRAGETGGSPNCRRAISPTLKGSS